MIKTLTPTGWGKQKETLMATYKAVMRSAREYASSIWMQAHHIHFLKGNNEFIFRTFRFQSVYVWNSILQNININVSFHTFKYILKRFLLDNNTSVRYDK